VPSSSSSSCSSCWSLQTVSAAVSMATRFAVELVALLPEGRRPTSLAQPRQTSRSDSPGDSPEACARLERSTTATEAHLCVHIQERSYVCSTLLHVLLTCFAAVGTLLQPALVARRLQVPYEVDALLPIINTSEVH